MKDLLPIPPAVLKGKTITQLELESQDVRHTYRGTLKEKFLPQGSPTPPFVSSPQNGQLRLGGDGTVGGDTTPNANRQRQATTSTEDAEFVDAESHSMLAEDDMGPSATTRRQFARKPSPIVPGHFSTAPIGSPSGSPVRRLSPIRGSTFDTQYTDTVRVDPFRVAPYPESYYAPAVITGIGGSVSRAAKRGGENPVLDGPTYRHVDWLCNGCMVCLHLTISNYANTSIS